MRTSLNIQNLKCGGCATTITSELLKINGISNIEINLEENKVDFDFLNEDLIQLVKYDLSNLGYPVVGDTNSVIKKAKSYVSCAIGKMKS